MMLMLHEYVCVALLALLGWCEPMMVGITCVVTASVLLYFDRDLKRMAQLWMNVWDTLPCMNSRVRFLEQAIYSLRSDVDYLMLDDDGFKDGLKGDVVELRMIIRKVLESSMKDVACVGDRVNNLEGRLNDVLAMWMDMKDELTDVRNELVNMRVKDVKRKRLERVVKQLS